MKTPKHIGFIMDGNRRWAKKRGKHPWDGHRKGAEKLKEVVKWCEEIGVEEITLYTFSIQNFNRAEKEVKLLMKIFEQETNKFLEDSKEKAREKGRKITFMGRTEMLPKSVQENIKKVEEVTKENDKFRINFAMAYGGREEVVDACKKVVEEIQNSDMKVDDIDEETFSQYLYNSSEPDMVIRTSGEVRTSNFLIWQAAYSEWFFVEDYWPGFRKEELLRCVDEYKENRERRFGK